MDNTEDPQKGVSEQPGTQTTVTAENGATIVGQVAESNQDLDEFRSDTKWEFTPLEKASYDCSDMYLESETIQPQHHLTEQQPGQELSEEPQQIANPELTVQESQQHIEEVTSTDQSPQEHPTNGDSISKDKSNLITAQEAQQDVAYGSSILGSSSVDAQMEKVIDKLVESGGCQQFVQTLELQQDTPQEEKESPDLSDHKMDVQDVQKEPEKPAPESSTSAKDVHAIPDVQEDHPVDKPVEAESVAAAIDDLKSSEPENEPEPEPETNTIQCNESEKVTETSEPDTSSDSKREIPAEVKTPARGRRIKKQSNEQFESFTKPSVQGEEICEQSLRSKQQLLLEESLNPEEECGPAKSDTTVFIQALDKDGEVDGQSLGSCDDISDLVVDQTMTMDSTNQEMSTDKLKPHEELSSKKSIPGDDLQLQSDQPAQSTFPTDGDTSTPALEPEPDQKQEPVSSTEISQRPIRSTRTRASSAKTPIVEVVKTTRSARKSRTTIEDNKDESKPQEVDKIKVSATDSGQIEEPQQEEQEVAPAEESPIVKSIKTPRGRSARLQATEMTKIKVDRRPTKRPLEVEETPQAGESEQSTSRMGSVRKPKLPKITLKPRDTQRNQSEPIHKTPQAKKGSSMNRFSSDSTYENDISRKYRCKECGYSTDRLNNIVYHHKHLFLCKGGQKIHEARVKNWVHSAEFAKGNKKRQMK